VDLSGGCSPATVQPSPVQHIYAEDGLEVTRVSFSSCYVPGSVPEGNTFWSQADLWLWLGDNVYSDGTDMDWKRVMYNRGREQASYVSDGPVKEGDKIPVMATWDDHDFASNNQGKEYACTRESQEEFVRHFNVPSTDPIHWSYPGGAQTGVYNSRLFLQPGTQDTGLHVIMLDARSGRDPTYSSYGTCKGSESKMLSDVQWQWLEDRLDLVKSEVTVIASGTQVLAPTCQTTSPSEFCADDSHSGGGSSFQDAIAAVGEGSLWPGTSFESWGEMPQERAKLLGLAQRAINQGNTKAVVFVTGDQHWAELMTKEMPESEAYGPAQALYEVTGSGVYQDFNHDIPNGNRLRARSCDHQGDGPFNQACVFPFRYQGTTYRECTFAGSDAAWCSTLTDHTDTHQSGYWGNCAPLDQELVQSWSSNTTHGCTESDFHICRAKSNYGFLEVDFSSRRLRMGVRTPEEGEEVAHTVSY